MVRLLASALLSARAAIAVPELELDWKAPAQCPDAAMAEGRITTLVGEDATSTHFVHAEVRITELDGGYLLQLRTEDTGERELVSDDCDELVDTAALIIAIAIDPRIVDRLAHETPRPEVPSPPSVADVTQGGANPARAPAPASTTRVGVAREPSPPLPKPRERMPPQLLGRVVAGLVVGAFPSPTAELGASIGFAWRHARVELESSYAVRRPISSRTNEAVGVLAQSWSAGMRGCGVLARGRLVVPLCGIARAGLLHAHGHGALAPRSTQLQPWVGVGPGVALVVTLRPRLALVFGLDALVAAVTGGFRTEPSGTIRTPWPVSLHAWTGIQWRRVTGRERGGQPRR